MKTTRISMKYLALTSTAIVLAAATGYAQAQAFRCPRTGGDLIYAGPRAGIEAAARSLTGAALKRWRHPAPMPR